VIAVGTSVSNHQRIRAYDAAQRGLADHAQRLPLVATLSLLGAIDPATAAEVRRTAVSYPSPHGVVAQCIAPDWMPGAVYTDEDEAQEKAFCGIDFYTGTRALCP